MKMEAGPRPAAIADPRFSRLHSDPRFQRMPKGKAKVSIDSRFSHIFSDRNFQDPLGVDKRGRVKKKKENQLLRRYYKVDDDSAGRRNGEGEDDEVVEREEPVESKKLDRVKDKTGKKLREASQAEKKKSQRVFIKGEKKQETEEKMDSTTKKRRRKHTQFEEDDEESEQELVLDEDDNEQEVGVLTPDRSKENSEVDARAMAARKSHKAQGTESSSAWTSDDGGAKKGESGEEGLTSATRGRKSGLSMADGVEPSSSEEISEWGSDSEAETSSSSSEGESDREEKVADEEEKVPTTNQETRRLAIMNMDWEHILAVDLLVLMQSFIPKVGRVESVAVYPSEFGLQQMEVEEAHGPRAIFEKEEEEEETDEIDMEKLRLYEKNKLRYYYAVVECDSRETSNYLYQQCDGMEFERTSNTLDLRFIPDHMKFERAPRDVAKDVPEEYRAPEFQTRALQHSNVKLTWDDDEPHRVTALRRKFNADQLNEMDFRSYLASESEEEEEEVDDDADRVKPGGSEVGGVTGDQQPGEGRPTKVREKYRALLVGDTTDDSPVSKQSGKGDVDMEVTFHTGLDDLSERLLQKKEAKQRGDETVWEAYLRKKKERKVQRKKGSRGNHSSDPESDDETDISYRVHLDSDPFVTDDKDGFDDPFFATDGEVPGEGVKEGRRVHKQRAEDGLLGTGKRVTDGEHARREEIEKKKEEKGNRAELELLLMDDHGLQAGLRGFNLKHTKDKSRKKDRGEKKGIRSKTRDEEEEDKMGTANLDDPRFASLFSNHHFAIDPTDPRFRKSAAQLKILAEVQRRRLQQTDAGLETRLDGGDKVQRLQNRKVANVEDGVQMGNTDRKRKAELSFLVGSLKRKVGGKVRGVV